MSHSSFSHQYFQYWHFKNSVCFFFFVHPPQAAEMKNIQQLKTANAELSSKKVITLIFIMK